jgi:hypothetical protein
VAKVAVAGIVTRPLIVPLLVALRTADPASGGAMGQQLIERLFVELGNGVPNRHFG